MQDGEAKPRLEFGRGRAGSKGPAGPAARKHVPMEDVLAKMAGKIGERRRAAEAQRAGGRAADELAQGESA